MKDLLPPSFASPPAAYRAKPFWSWNGRLDESELKRQIDVMRGMGFGGFFMHSRTGLRTEYLGERWFDCVRFCAEYAHKLGLEAWLYDEDRWPSGSAGGMAAKDESRRAAYLKENRFRGPADAAAFAVRADENGRLSSYYPLGKDEKPREGFELVCYSVERMQNSLFYNDYAYIDTLDREAVEEFFRLTHERYAAKVGDLFGKEIKGFFVDEPYRGQLFAGLCIDNPGSRGMAPYTGLLFDAYRDAWGEDLSLKLPELFFPCESRVKFRYVELIQRLFDENFMRPYQTWCRDHDLLLTGHVIQEDSLSGQVALCGSVMRSYRYMDAPGVDVLGEDNDCWWIPHACASVARQYGRPWVLGEQYGCCGWRMGLENYKQVSDWQALFGVSLRCPHLSWYTMEGQAKRDYPASILHQSAWYTDWYRLEDYFARVGTLITAGRSAAELAVVTPVESEWRLIRSGWLKRFDPEDEAVRALDAAQEKTFRALVRRHAAFDQVDEGLLADDGTAGTDARGAYIRLGKAVYRSLLLPEGGTCRDSTLALAEKFRALGGKILSGPDEAEPALGLDGLPGQIGVSARNVDGGIYLFLLNLDREKGARAAFTLQGEHSVAEADCRNGNTRPVKYDTAGGLTRIELDFAAGEEHILLLGGSDENAGGTEKETPTGERITAAGPFAYELTEPNVLPLDYAEAWADGERLTDKPVEVLKLDDLLRDKYKLPRRGGEMVQPWFFLKNDPDGFNRAYCALQLTYRFRAQTTPGSVRLAVERIENKRVSLNGVPLEPTGEYWVDGCFGLLDATAALRVGDNVVTVEMPFGQSEDVEAVYLLGPFGVRLPGTVVPLADRLCLGDVTEQGLPFYGGSVVYRVGLKPGRWRVTLDGMKAALVKAKGGGAIFARPYVCEAYSDGETTLEYVLTRRNTFGPLHLTPMKQITYGPGSFVSEGRDWTDDYMLAESGMTRPAVFERIREADHA